MELSRWEWSKRNGVDVQDREDEVGQGFGAGVGAGRESSVEEAAGGQRPPVGGVAHVDAQPRRLLLALPRRRRPRVGHALHLPPVLGCQSSCQSSMRSDRPIRALLGQPIFHASLLRESDQNRRSSRRCRWRLTAKWSSNLGITQQV